ncbi:MAG: hypothetical protein IPM56_16115 [Ignavibacteriales bacterium]|nr:MAG: hypothetical protein IPM56_16115 [Ignavibacteriales bacterium]
MNASEYEIKTINGEAFIEITCGVCGRKKLMKLQKYCSAPCSGAAQAETHQKKYLRKSLEIKLKKHKGQK